MKVADTMQTRETKRTNKQKIKLLIQFHRDGMYVLTACFYGDALKFTKKAPLKKIHGNSNI